MADFQDMPGVVLKPGADRRIRGGHLWIFSNEMRDGFQQLEAGTLAVVHAPTGKPLGIATINPHSLIAGRLLTRTVVPLNRAFFIERLQQAMRFRERLYGVLPAACRVVFSEADGLPGLIVDKFNEVLVVQITTAGMERLLDQVVSCLDELFRPSCIVLANDSSIRTLEGLPLYRKLASGSLIEPIIFEINNIKNVADPLHGQKTGFFLDQASNRLLLSRFIRNGSSVLDLFCFSGGFGLIALQAGAAHVRFVDSSDHALALAKRAVELNGWLQSCSFDRTDIFEFLKTAPEPYDVVILDPPALVKSRTKVPAALRAYRDLNARAIKWIKPGGLLATASCSGLVQLAAWREILSAAANKADRRMRIIATGGQAPDHPILSSMPETEYLKFVVAEIS